MLEIWRKKSLTKVARQSISLASLSNCRRKESTVSLVTHSASVFLGQCPKSPLAFSLFNMLGCHSCCFRGPCQCTSTSYASQYKAALIRDFSEQVLPLFTADSAGGKLRPRVIKDRVFPLGQIREAHAHMESNQSIGKILLQVRPEQDPQHDELWRDKLTCLIKRLIKQTCLIRRLLKQTCLIKRLIKQTCLIKCLIKQTCLIKRLIKLTCLIKRLIKLTCLIKRLIKQTCLIKCLIKLTRPHQTSNKFSFQS